MLTIYLTSVIDSSTSDAEQLEALIVRVAAGDDAAFAALYDATRTAVYAFALSMLRNSHDAEDVMQDCYVAVHASAGEYRPFGKPMAWIITITRNLCLRRLRARRYSAELDDEDWGDVLPDSDAVTMEDRVILRACMEALSDEARQIIVLHAVSGFKHREIADLLELPLATILSKYHRALKKLRRALS